MGNIEIKKVYEWPAIAQIAAIAAIGILVFYLGYMFDLSPMRDEINIQKDQEATLVTTYKSTVREHVSSLNAVLQVPRLKLLLAKWRTKLIKPEEFPAVQDKILNLAELNQVKVNSFTPGEEVKQGDYTVLPIKVQVTGTYEQTATFMSQIANLDKLVVLGNFSMYSSNPGGNAPVQPINSNNPVDTLLNVYIYKF